MHLTDEQLQDVDNSKAGWDSTQNDRDKESKPLEEHLSHCTECKNRLRNLRLFRTQLANNSETKMPDLQWQAIEREINVDLNETAHISTKAGANNISMNKSTQIVRLSQKVTRLQTSLIAMAASLLIILVASHYSKQDSKALELQLAAVIKENHKLQTDFSAFRQTSYIQAVTQKATQMKLQEIDRQIQLSYLDKLTSQQKIDLWNERKQVLIQSLSNKPQQTVFTI